MAKSEWVIDASHTVVEFSVKHMMIATVKGRFSAVEGVILADPADLTGAEIGIKVEVSSIDTREAQRDGHLKSADFLDVETFPHLTFKSKEVAKNGDDYKLTGDLTIHGVTRQVVLDLTYEGHGKDPWGNERIGLSAEGKIDRKDYGLTWNAVLESGGILVGDTVRIAISGEAVKQAA